MGIGKDLARQQRTEDDSSLWHSFMQRMLNPETDVAGILVRRESVVRRDDSITHPEWKNPSSPSYSTRIQFYVADKLVFEHVDTYWGAAKFPIAKTKKYMKG